MADVNLDSNQINTQGSVILTTTNNTTYIHSPPSTPNQVTVDPRRLHKACRDHNVHYAKEVLDYMKLEDINYADEDDHDNTALHLATMAHCTEIVEILLVGQLIDVNTRNTSGDTPLMIASEKGFDDIVALLLRKPGIDLNIQRPWTRGSDTALIFAASGGHTSVVRLLLDHGGIEPNKQNVHGVTALLRASARGHTEVVRLLLGYGDVNPNISDKGNETALDVALVYKREEIVQLLREKGAVKGGSCCIA